MTEVEIAWLAGLLEGEGSFLFAPPSSPNCPRLVISMTDLDVIEKVARCFGVQYIKNDRRNPEKWKTSYLVQLSGHSAMNMMRLVYPHMGERRKKRIEEILEKYQNIKPRNKLTEAQARDILSLKGLHSAREVAGQFQLSIKTIEKIWKGSRWPQLQGDLNHPTQSNTGTS